MQNTIYDALFILVLKSLYGVGHFNHQLSDNCLYLLLKYANDRLWLGQKCTGGLFSLNFTQKSQPLICHASINFYYPPIYCYFIPYLDYQYTKFARLWAKLDIHTKVNNRADFSHWLDTNKTLTFSNNYHFKRVSE